MAIMVDGMTVLMLPVVIFLLPSTYEVAKACALALKAQKLICIIDGRDLDESGRLINFLSVEDADKLIRERVIQSETTVNYVEAVEPKQLMSFDYNRAYGLDPHVNGKAAPGSTYCLTFQNGVGFDNGNGLWPTEQGFAIGGQEKLSRLNGYLSGLLQLLLSPELFAWLCAFGNVYRGTFETEGTLAIKELLPASRTAIEEFQNEIILISKVKHGNLVRLVGFCEPGSKGRKLLIHEYVGNDSLLDYIIGKEGRSLRDSALRWRNLCCISGNTYFKDEVLQMEFAVLNYLKFEMIARTPKCFLR